MQNSSLIMQFVRFAGNAVKFMSDDRRILSAIDIHFAHCLGVDESVVAEYQVWAEKEASHHGDELFSVLRNGDHFQSNIRLDQVLWYLMQDGLMQLNGASTTHLVFHAAALAYLDQGLILCGKSGSGKSTLTTWLTASGFQYLSDEVIALPVSGGEINGFSRSITLKTGSALFWESRFVKVETPGLLRLKDGGAWIAPTLLNTNAIRASVMPRMLVFPTYSPEAEFQVERLTSANALFRLLQNLVNARNFPDNGMDATARLAREVNAYSVTYSDMETVHQWICKTIQES